MPYIFPPFEAWVHPSDISRVNLRKQNGGYSFGETTLERLLTNEVYIGTYRREGVVRTNNHPAIVEEGLFWAVYDHLKDFRPDGTPTGRIRLVRYTQQREKSDRDPLLMFTSSQPKVFVSFHRGKRNHYHYVARIHNGMTRDTLLAADANIVEGIVVKKLMEKLRQVDVENLEEKRKAIMQEHVNRVKKLERLVETIDEETDTLTENMGKVKTEAVIKQLEKQIAKLLARRAKAQADIETLTQSYQDLAIGSLEEELQDLEEYWDARSFGLRRSLLRLLIKEAKIDYISPRFYSITIEWAYGNWGIEQAFIDKGQSNKVWREEENDVLRTMYRDRSQQDIMQVLPHRTWYSIWLQARQLGLTDGIKKKLTIRDRNICMKDLAFLKKSEFTLEQFCSGNGVIWSSLCGAGP